MNIHWKWEVLNKSKICVFKSCYKPVLTYEAETWTWVKVDISILMVAEVG